jgi:hypothetical protein
VDFAIRTKNVAETLEQQSLEQQSLEQKSLEQKISGSSKVIRTKDIR